MTTVYDYSVDGIDGSSQSLADYQGKVLLIVNTASECGFTSQYDGLEALYKTYKDRGLVVLGFPCNQFGGQEPGTNEQISEFCRVRFGVSFPLHVKVDVNGKDTHPLFDHIKNEAPGMLGSTRIKWNFTKFLVDRNGTVISRFAPNTEPEKISQEIESLLGTSD